MGSIEIDIIIVATGILHGDNLSPEKSLRDLDMESFQQVFAINTFGPALIAKHFLPLLPKNKKSVFAAISARVGSIDDNRLGGWYAYRASKAALNMILKNTSVEMGRKYKNLAAIGLPPGTVDTHLSEPFQGNVQPDKLFSAEYSAKCLIRVIDNASASDSGNVYAWDGQKIPS